MTTWAELKRNAKHKLADILEQALRDHIWGIIRKENKAVIRRKIKCLRLQIKHLKAEMRSL